MNLTLREISDKEVVERVINGDKELYEILIRRNNQRLYRAIRSYIYIESDVEDVMQEAYIKAFQNLKQFRKEAAFSTWLIRIGINEALKRIKEKRRMTFAQAWKNNTEEKNPIVKIPDTMNLNPENKAIQHETHELLEYAIQKLPEKYRVVFMLKEVEGMSNAEISKSINITESNAKVRLHRAKEMLKETINRLISRAEVFEFGQDRCDRMTRNVMNCVMQDDLYTE